MKLSMRTALPVLTLTMLVATPAMAADLKQADLNHDGKVTKAEAQQTRMAQFSKMDRNGDGVLTEADAKSVAWILPGAADAMRRLIASADTNHDGKVTKEELAVAPTPNFDKADLNHDGVLDAQELAKANK